MLSAEVNQIQNENNNENLTDEVWIIDTDYSIDDQIALDYLLKKLNIIAITVCGAGTASPSIIKARIEYDFKHKYSQEYTIPVYAGADRPFINYQKELKDDEIFDSYNYEKTDYSVYEEEAKKNSPKIDINTKISNMASVKIAELVRTHEKSLNILTLGPITNISLAVLIDFSIKDKFNNLYIVGGSYNNLGNSGNSAEYNFRVDPVAAKNVIHYYKNITLIPLEVEEQIKLGGLDEYFTEKYEVFKRFVTHINEETEESRSRHSFLGLFGAVLAANPKCQKLIVKRPTDVDIIGRFTRGSLAIEKYDHLKSGKFNEIKIIEDVDVELFKEIFSTFLKN